MDEQRRNAFLVARGLLEHGEGSIDGTAPTAIAAVILYDTAVETAAKATLAAHRPRGFPGTVSGREHLPGVLDQLLAAYREREHDSNAELPGLADARQLHHYRNGVQHAGTIPSGDDLVRQRLRASDFLDSLAWNFFRVRLPEISRTSLIQVEHVRDQVQEAEKALAEGELDNAASAVATAVWMARDALCERRPIWPSLSRTWAERAVEELRSAFGQARPVVAAAGAGGIPRRPGETHGGGGGRALARLPGERVRLVPEALPKGLHAVGSPAQQPRLWLTGRSANDPGGPATRSRLRDERHHPVAAIPPGAPSRSRTVARQSR
jgi:hypothetical protein